MSKSLRTKPTQVQEAARLLAPKPEPQPRLKPSLASVHNCVKDEPTKFIIALIGDLVNVLRACGQNMARINKVCCTELLFLETAETTSSDFAIQTVKSPQTMKFKSVTSNAKM